MEIYYFGAKLTNGEFVLETDAKLLEQWKNMHYQKFG
jgi:hypothetical protein